jgi:hypothetical protein
MLHQVLPALQVMGSAERDPASLDTGLAAGPTARNLGDFRILREVGRGGMGIVYEAEQISLGRRVALKVLPFASTLDPKQLQRFKNEAQAAAHLHHQNIVPVYATGCERGVHYYAMQFIGGQTVAAIIADLRRQVFASLALTAPKTVRSDGEAPNADSWSLDVQVQYVFPQTKYTTETLTLNWYNGGKRPPTEVKALLGGGELEYQGSIYIGKKGQPNRRYRLNRRWKQNSSAYGQRLLSTLTRESPHRGFGFAR